MAQYKVTSPEGKQYLLTGPAGATREQVFEVLKYKLGQQEPQPGPDDVAEASPRLRRHEALQQDARRSQARGRGAGELSVVLRSLGQRDAGP